MPNLIRNGSPEPCLEHLRLLRNLMGTDSGAERPIMLRTVWLKGGIPNDTFSKRLTMVLNGVRFLKCWGRGRVFERPLSLTIQKNVVRAAFKPNCSRDVIVKAFKPNCSKNSGV